MRKQEERDNFTLDLLLESEKQNLITDDGKGGFFSRRPGVIFVIARTEKPEIERITKTIILKYLFAIWGFPVRIGGLRKLEPWNVKAREKRPQIVFIAPVQASAFADDKSDWLSDLPRMPHLISWPTRSRTWPSGLWGWGKGSWGSHGQLTANPYVNICFKYGSSFSW